MAAWALVGGLVKFLNQRKVWNNWFWLALLVWVMHFRPRLGWLWWVGAGLAAGGTWVALDETNYPRGGRRWLVAAVVGTLLYVGVLPRMFRFVYYFCAGWPF